MTDGAVTVLQSDGVAAELRNRVLPRLLSRDPAVAWTSGQWMTEATGGSDVGRTSTRASRGADGGWRLSGEKWFCSAVTSEVAVVLAREDGAPAGSRGLACFVVPRYAEVAAGSPGHAGGTWTAAAGMRRGLMLARNHAAGRSAFGTRLDQQPLHRETLSWLAVDAEAAFALTALAFSLLGRLEVDGDAAAAAALCSRVTSTRRIIRGSPGAAGSPTGQASASSRPTSALGSARVPSLSLSRCRRRPVAVVQVPPAWPGEPAATSA